MDQYIYRATTVMPSTDVDAHQEIKMSGLFSLSQRVVVAHAGREGIDREDALEKYGATWMAMRIHLRLCRPLLADEEVTCISRMRESIGNRYLWDCEFLAGDEKVGEQTTVWCLVDWATGKSISLDNVAELPKHPYPNAMTDRPERIRFPENMELYDERKLYYSDTDMNGHVNNARIVDIAADAAQLHLRTSGVFLEEITVSYIGQCFAGETLRLYRGKRDGYMYIHAVGPDGSDRFDCCLRMSDDQDM